MDFDSSSKFIASLAKFLQSLCNGYVEFDKGVEVIGHIYLSVDSNTAKKIDYVLNEKVCKNDNSVTFISNSFHAQPAEKPKPPKKASESDKQSDDIGELDESGQAVPNSTNVGTIGSYRASSGATSQDSSYSPGGKRPRSPNRRGNLGKGLNPPQSTRYQDSGGSMAKMSRTDIPQSPSNSNYGAEDYDNSGVFQGGDDEDGYSSYLNSENGGQEIDQKPVIDPDISIVKEEYMASQQNSCAYAGNNQTSGPGRGKSQSQTAYPTMLHENTPSSFQNPPSSHPSESSYSGTSIEGADPSGLTRAQQEELEMYYRKGTDQHLTFLRNMREAHAMYPFTGKRDKELFDKALAELLFSIPILKFDIPRLLVTFCARTAEIRYEERRSKIKKGQFKSPGQSPRGGHQFGRRPYQRAIGMGQPYSPYQGPGYPATPGSMSEGGDSYLQGPGDESYDYQQMGSEDSQNTQQSDLGLQPSTTGFHGAFADTSQIGGEQQPFGADGTGETKPPSPLDIKVEVTPVNFIKQDDNELIEIEDDDEI